MKKRYKRKRQLNNNNCQKHINEMGGPFQIDFYQELNNNNFDNDDLIRKQSSTNDTSPEKELMEKWIFIYVNENGGVVVLDALDQASATVTERLNGLLDQKYDDILDI